MSKIVINKKYHTITEKQKEKRLIDFLREDLDLIGTKNRCDIGVCGSCTVLVNNEVEKACRRFVKDVMDKELLTIEGMAGEDGTLHPLQQVFIDEGTVQCGFCIPGMILTAHSFLLKNNRPTREQIRKAINPNLCRCTGYQQIVNAIEKASEFYR